MSCMKCGQKLKGNEAFCDECLAIMAQYPVKPGTPIQLPSRSITDIPSSRSTRKRSRKPDDQLARLRASVRWLKVALLLVTLAFLIAVIMVLWLLDGPAIFG